ncbi:MAG: hypothetical protein M1476_04535 [Candidatus Thermoplasmatota archaeon]|nr:hypothetical protein [Candidatus Thermoplasmatota archaeon]
MKEVSSRPRFLIPETPQGLTFSEMQGKPVKLMSNGEPFFPGLKSPSPITSPLPEYQVKQLKTTEDMYGTPFQEPPVVPMTEVVYGQPVSEGAPLSGQFTPPGLRFG